MGARGETSEDCAGYNRAIFNVHASLLQPTGNVIAVMGTDFGVHNLLDVSVEAVLSTPPEPPTPGVPAPITSCSASDALADAVVLTWNDVDNEAGYRIFRDGVLLDRTVWG